MKLYKYPRTLHLPYSNPSSDDKILSSVEHFADRVVVVTDKVDGENTTMYFDHIHARSLDSKHHPSRSMVKALHASIKQGIPNGWRITGENLYAKHSIHYTSLDSYFYVFAIYNENNLCLSWDDTVGFATMLNLATVPVLYRGLWDLEKVKSCWKGISELGGEQEGYVVRVADAFAYAEHAISTAKYVRDSHVTTSEHWMKEQVVPNLLKPKVVTEKL